MQPGIGIFIKNREEYIKLILPKLQPLQQQKIIQNKLLNINYYLNLNYNKIKSIPPEIGQLNKLEQLFLYYNKFRLFQ